MAACVPAGLPIPLLVVAVTGDGGTLPEETEAWLRSALPRRSEGELVMGPWAVFLAQGLQEAPEALSQGVQWLVQHGPRQPDLQVRPWPALCTTFHACACVSSACATLCIDSAGLAGWRAGSQLHVGANWSSGISMCTVFPNPSCSMRFCLSCTEACMNQLSRSSCKIGMCPSSRVGLNPQGD